MPPAPDSDVRVAVRGREWTPERARGTVETMSRESESEQPGQRTVADLLAQYGGQPTNGPRRRRRRAEDDEDAGPQQIIDRVLSESGRQRPIRDEPMPPAATPPLVAPQPAAAQPAAEPAQPRPAESPADARTGYFEPPTAYVQMPVALDPGRRPDARPARPESSVDPRADEPTGFLDPVRLDQEPPSQPDRPSRPSGRPERPTGYREHPAADQSRPYPPEPATQPAMPDRPTGYRPAADTPEPSGRPEPDPLTDTGRFRYGAAAADAARAGRNLARASWPVGGLSQPIREPVAESRTEQIPRIGAALEGTELIQPVGHPDDAGVSDADAPDTWYALDDEPNDAPPRPAVATSLMVPLSGPGGADHDAAPHGVDDYQAEHPGDDHFGADHPEPDYHPDYFAGTDAEAGQPSAEDAEPDEPAPSGSPLQQWLLLIGQLVGGIVGGAALWLGFQFLWRQIPVLALVLAAVVTVGLVLVVRKIRKADDLQTMVLAVLVGLVVTVTPAAFLLVGQ